MRSWEARLTKVTLGTSANPRKRAPVVAGGRMDLAKQRPQGGLIGAAESRMGAMIPP